MSSDSDSQPESCLRHPRLPFDIALEFPLFLWIDGVVVRNAVKFFFHARVDLWCGFFDAVAVGVRIVLEEIRAFATSTFFDGLVVADAALARCAVIEEIMQVKDIDIGDFQTRVAHLELVMHRILVIAFPVVDEHADLPLGVVHRRVDDDDGIEVHKVVPRKEEGTVAVRREVWERLADVLAHDFVRIHGENPVAFALSDAKVALLRKVLKLVLDDARVIFLCDLDGVVRREVVDDHELVEILADTRKRKVERRTVVLRNQESRYCHSVFPTLCPLYVELNFLRSIIGVQSFICQVLPTNLFTTSPPRQLQRKSFRLQIICLERYPVVHCDVIHHSAIISRHLSHTSIFLA